MNSRFTFAGHPLHPMLITLPIGLFAWAFVADIVYLAMGAAEQTWYDISFWTGIAAIVTALVAALPGFGDYATLAVHSKVLGMATVHMLMNLVIVGLFLVAGILQINNGATAGGALTAVVALHGVGVAMLAVSGWLGGQLSHRHHLAMIPETPEVAREEHARHQRHAEAGR
jgi:uncharacterized membrane protein